MGQAVRYRRQEDLLRQRRIIAVELRDIGDKIIILIAVVREQRDVPFNQLALAHVLDVHSHPAFVHRVAKHIAVQRIGRRDLLLLHQRVDVA